MGRKEMIKFPRTNLEMCGDILGCQNWAYDIGGGQECCSIPYKPQIYNKEVPSKTCH